MYTVKYMNSLLDTKAISCAKKCLLLPYLEESIHKAMKISLRSICKSNILKDKNNFCWKEKVICSLINCISMCILIFCRAIVHKPIQSLNCTTKLLNSMRRKMYALYCAIWLVHWILFNCKTYSGGMLHVLFIKDP